MKIQYFGPNRIRQLVQWIKSTFVKNTDLTNAPSADAGISYILVVDDSNKIKKISVEQLQLKLLGEHTYIVEQ